MLRGLGWAALGHQQGRCSVQLSAGRQQHLPGAPWSEASRPHRGLSEGSAQGLGCQVWLPHWGAECQGGPFPEVPPKCISSQGGCWADGSSSPAVWPWVGFLADRICLHVCSQVNDAFEGLPGRSHAQGQEGLWNGAVLASAPTLPSPPGSSLSLGKNLGSPSSVPAVMALSLCCPRSRPVIHNPVVTQGSPSPQQCHLSPHTRSRGGHD